MGVGGSRTLSEHGRIRDHILVRSSLGPAPLQQLQQPDRTDWRRPSGPAVHVSPAPKLMVLLMEFRTRPVDARLLFKCVKSEFRSVGCSGSGELVQRTETLQHVSRDLLLQILRADLALEMSPFVVIAVVLISIYRQTGTRSRTIESRLRLESLIQVDLC